MRYKITLGLIFIISILQAQKPKKPSSSEIFEAVQKLNVLASAMYIAAHPDDENTRLIAYLANHEKARTSYLSLTRGDGGQNLIGSELRELLGVIRTQELLAARGVDGGEQLFSRANDFGFSKHPDETFAIWDKNEVLSDVVLAIRKFKPDVIINRFDHRRAGRTHGHHTASAMLSLEAFDITNNPEVYSEQLKTLDTWQPTRIFYNTSWWRYGSRENFAKVDKSNMAVVDIGVFYPLKGVSNNELASIASSQHLCQGFGRLTFRGEQEEYLEFLKGEELNENKDIFSGIDTSWNRIDGGQAIAALLEPIEANFNFQNPAAHIPNLVAAYNLLQQSTNDHWKNIKSKELLNIIQWCAGLYLEASADTASATPGEQINLNFELLNRSEIPIQVEQIKLKDRVLASNLSLTNNQKQSLKETYRIDYNLGTSSPYWLDRAGTLGMYTVDDEQLIGLPETPAPLQIEYTLGIAGSSIKIYKDVVHRYSEPDKGELYKPFEVLPIVTSSFKAPVEIFNNTSEKEIMVTVKAGTNNIEGYVTVDAPEGWQVLPSQQKVEIANKYDTQNLIFTVFPPEGQSEGYIWPVIVVDNVEYDRKLVEIDYEHIPYQSVLLPNYTKVVRLPIQKEGTNIAYIEGAGDAVPESLQQIGYNVEVLKPSEINASRLNNFDAVVVGIRAYNILDDLTFKQEVLFDFVKNGGNMIVQYNTNRRLKTEQIAPYPLTLSRDRVTDENAQVTLIAPSHEVLNYPNKIVPSDFDGWVQERGLYFPNEWDDNFTPILAMNDPGESTKRGSLLVAKYGEGHYIYTGLSFFREFPAGVPGAFKLFANMLSLGKTNISNSPQIKN
ncbi:MAG: PIG-L family deacetylase [bacterium]